MEKKLLMTVTFVAAGITAGAILSMMTVSWNQFAQARPNCSSDADALAGLVQKEAEEVIIYHQI